METIGVTKEEFQAALNLTIPSSHDDTNSEDCLRIITKIEGGSGRIQTKEELALFLAFIFWESFRSGDCAELRCLRNDKINRDHNGWISQPEIGKVAAEKALDVAFWFWERNCHPVAKHGFWSVLAKVSPKDLNAVGGQKRAEHFEGVAKALGMAAPA